MSEHTIGLSRRTFLTGAAALGALSVLAPTTAFAETAAEKQAEADAVRNQLIGLQADLEAAEISYYSALDERDAAQKAMEFGAKVVTLSDSTGWVYDPDGIDLDLVKDIKEVRRARISEYVKGRPNAQYHEGRGVWSVKCDVALPCATQNELLLEDAELLVKNGCVAVAEGANMPTTLEATKYLQSHGVLFAPGKASNAGGVATSALEMSQNSERLSWSFEEVDQKLCGIMVDIFHKADEAAKKYGMAGDYVAGANIAGFEKVVDAMLAQGV